jgi:probable phosphomutase (TIGR03848 family)
MRSDNAARSRSESATERSLRWAVVPTPRSVSSKPARQARTNRTRTTAPAKRSGTLVLFVRHGKTPTTGKVLPGRAPGLHLAPEGRAQAERAAERIASLKNPPSAIYASPLDRTRETAAPIAAALGLRLLLQRGLLECDVGTWTGKRLGTLARSKQWATVQRWPGGFSFPQGESFAEMSTRANGAVLSIVADHPGETVVAVSHADPIKAIVAAAAGVPLDLFQRIVISPCSVSAVLYGAGSPIVLCVNNTGSLNELVPS